MDTTITTTVASVPSAPASPTPAALNGHGYWAAQGTTGLFPVRPRAFATLDMTAAASAVAVGVLGTGELSSDERGTVIAQGPPREDLC